MPESTINHPIMFAYLATELAKLERRAPTVTDLRRVFEIADVALTAVEEELGKPPPNDLEARAHAAHLAAIVLAKVIDAVQPVESADRARYRRTTTNMLLLLERIVSPAARALRERLLGSLDPQPVVRGAVIRA